MFSLTSMPSTTSVLSTYTTFAAAAMLIRTVINEVQTIVSQFIPQKFQDKIIAKFAGLFGNLPSSQMTLIIDESNGLSINEIYQASELYLSTRITPSIDQLKVSKTPRQNNFSVTINKGEKLIDEFEGMQLRWEFCCTETKQAKMDSESYCSSTEIVEHKSIQLSFHKQFRENVLGTYLPYVVERSKAIEEENKVVRLHALGSFGGSVIFDHPSTFDTLAMDSTLLYGPPGTGKSSLIAAMANYLKFDIYDLELTYLYSNSELKRLLVSTANRSIIVIEDIDISSMKLKNS